MVGLVSDLGGIFGSKKFNCAYEGISWSKLSKLDDLKQIPHVFFNLNIH